VILASNDELDLPMSDLSFARNAYRMVRIPKGIYANIASQTPDDGSFVLVEYDDSGHDAAYRLHYFSANPFPSDSFDATTISGYPLVA
jgi:hypothetical protein